MVTLSAPLEFLEYAEMDDDVLTGKPLTVREMAAESLSDAAGYSGAENSGDEPERASSTFSDAVAVLDILRAYVNTLDYVEGLKGFHILEKRVMFKRKGQATIGNLFKPL